LKLSTLILFAFLATLPLGASVLVVTNGNSSGAGSLSAAIGNAQNGDTIAFAPSVTGATIDLSAPISISVSVSIDGSGQLIEGSASGDIFDVTGSTVLFSNLTLEDTTTTGNTGDAINGSSSANVSVLDSTILGNANANGVVGDDTTTTTITNSTFSGNAVAIEGTNGGTFNLYDSTITAGGIGIENTTLTMDNTIVAGNTADIGSGNSIPTAYNNLIGVGGSGSITNGVDGNQAGVNPLIVLGPLANNGGPTQTSALLLGSPAINAGNNSLIPSGITTDQRGYQRIVNGTVDIGAFEVAPEPATYLTCLLGFAIAALRLRKR